MCSAYPALSDYGMEPLSGVEYGGMLSDLVRVPHADTMLTSLPSGLDPVAVASVPDNVLDGYRSVAAHLQRRPGADVVVACHGMPSIGLYAAQLPSRWGPAASPSPAWTTPLPGLSNGSVHDHSAPSSATGRPDVAGRCRLRCRSRGAAMGDPGHRT